MNFSAFTPWQFILWIVCVEMVSIPLIAILVGTIINGYFRAKENHVSRVMNAAAKAFEKITDDLTKKMTEKMKDNK